MNSEYCSAWPLFQHKHVLESLIRQFNTGRTVVFTNDLPQDRSKYDQTNTDLIKLQREIKEVERKMLQLYQRGADPELNYYDLLTQKQEEIIGLNTKICVLQKRLEGSQREYQRSLTRKDETIRGLQRRINNDLIIGEMDTIGRRYAQSLQIQLEQGMNQISNLISLDVILEGFILNLPSESIMKQNLNRVTESQIISERYRHKFSLASEIYKNQIKEFQERHPHFRIDHDQNILELLREENVIVYEVQQTKNIIVSKESIKEVKVAQKDQALLQIVKAFAFHLKHLHVRYPKLKKQIRSDLTVFLTDQIIERYTSGEIHEIVEIVKIIPEIVRVETNYEMRNEKDKKMIRNLKIMIKALMEVIERVRKQDGSFDIGLNIDKEILELLEKEIRDLIQPQTLKALKCLCEKPAKIIELPLLMEKCVKEAEQVPVYITLKTKESLVVPLQKAHIFENQKTFYLKDQKGVELIHQRAVIIRDTCEQAVVNPQLHHHPIKPDTICTEKLKVETVTLPKYLSKEIHVDCTNEIPATSTQYQKIKEVITEFCPVIQLEIEQAPCILEKIAPCWHFKQIPKFITLTKECVKVQNEIKYVDRPYILKEEKIKIEKEEVEVCVPLVHHTIQRVAVPQMVEIAIPGPATCIEVPKQVIICHEKMVVEPVIQCIDKIIPIKGDKIIVTQPKEIQIHHDKPYIHEKIRCETQYVEKPLIQKICETIHVPVTIQNFIPFAQKKPFEVCVDKHHLVRESVPVEFHDFETKTIPIYHQTLKEQIRCVERIVERIIEKPPRIIEVERCIQKIIPCPFIVQTIIPEPYMVQVLIPCVEEKVVYVVDTKTIEVPYFIEIPIYIDRVERIIVEVPGPCVRLPPDEILRTNTVHTSTETQVELIKERVCIELKECPVQYFRDRVEYLPTTIEKVEVVEIQTPFPYRVPYEFVVVHEKPVYLKEVIAIKEPIDRFVDKILCQEHTSEIIKEVELKKERICVQRVEVPREIPGETVIKKQIQVVHTCEQLQPVILYETIEKYREQPYLIETIKPFVIKEKNPYVICEKPEIFPPEKQPVFISIAKPLVLFSEKPIQSTITRLIPVEKLVEINCVEKIPASEKIICIKNTVYTQPSIEKEIIQVPLKQKIQISVQPDIIHCKNEILRTEIQKFQTQIAGKNLIHHLKIEVPCIFQKIVEKIIILPQFIHTLKYICECPTEEYVCHSDYLEKYQSYEYEIKQLILTIHTQIRQIEENCTRTHFRWDQTILRKFQELFHKTTNLIQRHPKIIDTIKNNYIIKHEEPEEVKYKREKEETLKIILIEKLANELIRIKQSNNEIQIDENIEVLYRISRFRTEHFGGADEEHQDLKRRFDELLKPLHDRFEEFLRNRNPENVDDNIFNYGELIASYFDEKIFYARKQRQIKEDRRINERENQELRQEIGRYQESIEQLKDSIISYTTVDTQIRSSLSQHQQAKYDTLMRSAKTVVTELSCKFSPKPWHRCSESSVIHNSVLLRLKEECIYMKKKINEIYTIYEKYRSGVEGLRESYLNYAAIQTQVRHNMQPQFTNRYDAYKAALDRFLNVTYPEIDNHYNMTEQDYHMEKQIKQIHQKHLAQKKALIRKIKRLKSKICKLQTQNSELKEFIRRLLAKIRDLRSQQPNLRYDDNDDDHFLDRYNNEDLESDEDDHHSEDDDQGGDRAYSASRFQQSNNSYGQSIDSHHSPTRPNLSQSRLFVVQGSNQSNNSPVREYQGLESKVQPSSSSKTEIDIAMPSSLMKPSNQTQTSSLESSNYLPGTRPVQYTRTVYKPSTNIKPTESHIKSTNQGELNNYQPSIYQSSTYQPSTSQPSTYQPSSYQTSSYQLSTQQTNTQHNQPSQTSTQPYQTSNINQSYQSITQPSIPAYQPHYQQSNEQSQSYGGNNSYRYYSSPSSTRVESLNNAAQSQALQPNTTNNYNYQGPNVKRI